MTDVSEFMGSRDGKGKSLSEKAEQAEQVDVTLPRQSAGLYRLAGDRLVDCDEITDEGKLPQYGEFIAVNIPDANGDDGHVELIACPAALAQWLVDESVEIGDSFRIRDVWKSNGSWEYQCRVIEE